MTQDAIVSIENLSYQYPNSPDLVLRDINLAVRRGEFLGLIGPTGAGKTTLCLALNGIVPQFYGGRFFGRVTVAGVDTLDSPIHLLAQHVAMVFQDPETQLVANSVEDEVAFPLENIRLPREEILHRVRWALDAVRLGGMEKKHPSELSGGQKQRLALAAALAMQPELLVLDEPTSQLDSMGSQEVFAAISELNAKLGMTIILVSHASEELAEFAERVALLAGGRVVDANTPERVFAQAKRLGELAVRPPQVTHLFSALRDRGLTSDHMPVTLAEATQAYEGLRPAPQLRPFHPGEDAQAPGAQPPLLSAQDVHYVYPDGTEALRGVSLDVREGEYIVIVGQNGAGKTTLVKTMLNLLQPTEGQVRLGGRDVRELGVSGLAERIGFVAQNPDDQIFSTSVEAEVAFALKNLGLSAADVAERTEQSLATMGLTEHRTWHPLALPKGDRARVVIAAVLAMHPSILIFDEPTTGQDDAGARRILDVSRSLHQAGKTVIAITHHLHLMPGYAERAVVMGRGTVMLDAPLRHAFHQTELLRSTFLVPPQIVQFAQWLSERENLALSIVTPDELSSCVAAARPARPAELGDDSGSPDSLQRRDGKGVHR